MLVSLLTPEEIAELNLEQEKALCHAAGLQFLSSPIPDRSVPADQDTALRFATKQNGLHSEGKRIVIHCPPE